MFSGLCAFPLTSASARFDEKRLCIRRLDAGVVSGHLRFQPVATFISREQRRRVVQVAKTHAGSIRMMASASAPLRLMRCYAWWRCSGGGADASSH